MSSRQCHGEITTSNQDKYTLVGELPDLEAFLAVGWKWGQESGARPMDIDAMTRKG